MDIKHTLILAHGAGLPMDSDWLNTLSEKFNYLGVKVIRFNFPYMQQRVDSGKKMPPNKLPILIDCFNDIIDNTAGKVFIGGKSMGGRIATMVANNNSVKGVIAFGYPFHPVGKPEKMRTEHLKQFKKPCLIIQGERDPFGKKDEWQGFSIDPNIDLFPIKTANHDLKPLKSSGLNLDNALDLSVSKAIEFMDKHG